MISIHLSTSHILLQPSFNFLKQTFKAVFIWPLQGSEYDQRAQLESSCWGGSCQWWGQPSEGRRNVMRHRDILTILGVCTVYIFTFQEASISMYYCSNEKCMTSRRFFPNKPYICIPSWWIFHPGTCKLTSCWFTELMCRYPSNGIPNQGIVGLSALALEALLLMVIGCCCVQYVHPNMFFCGNSQASMV